MIVAKKEETRTLVLLFVVFPQLTQPSVSYFRVVKVSLCVVSVCSWFRDLV